MSVVYEKEFTCRRCQCVFVHKARWCWYCPTCRKAVWVENVMRSRKRKYPETRVGVGSGGAQVGKRNHAHKDFDPDRCYSGLHGDYYVVRAEAAECAICKATECLHVHHVNGDRRDSSRSNLQVLCVKCHNAVHSKGLVGYKPTQNGEPSAEAE